MLFRSINLYLISNKKTFKNLIPSLKKKVIFKDVNKIKLKRNHVNFKKNTLLDKNWYQGFWRYTSERFFYLQNIVESENLENIIHVENDLMIYFDLNSKINIFKNNYNIGLLLDSNIKAIPSFLYFKNKDYLNKLIYFFENQNSFTKKLFFSIIGRIYSKLFRKSFFSNNDMNVLFNFYLSNLKDKKINLLPSSTPTMIKNKKYSKNIKLSKNFNKFRGIFDPASFGFYLDGFDKNLIFKNNNVDKIQGVSKSAVDVTKYKILFRSSNKKKIPYLVDNGKKINFLTLHIHSKRLNKFLSK